MSITKYIGFTKQLTQNLVLVFHRKHFGATELLNSVTPKQLLESKLENSVRPSHSSVTPRLLGFHKELDSVTPICNFRSDRKVQVQWPRPNR